MGLDHPVDPSSSVGLGRAMCPRCQSTSRLSNGLCLKCLLLSAIDVSTVEVKSEKLDDVLASTLHLADILCVDGYEILNELGRGGMGIIYRARERQSGRIV